VLFPRILIANRVPPRRRFSTALKKFSAADFKKAGYPDKVRERFVTLSQQEADHVRLLSSALGDAAVKQCKYIYGLSSVKGMFQVSHFSNRLSLN